MKILLSLFLFLSLASPIQKETASFQVNWKISGATQAEADQKLARYFAPFVEAEGLAVGLCLKNPDETCQKDEAGDVLYDLAKVTEALEVIFRNKIDAAAKARFVSSEIDKARLKAVEDAEKKEKPGKSAAIRPPN